jgi:hypothetical protein
MVLGKRAGGDIAPGNVGLPADFGDGLQDLVLVVNGAFDAGDEIQLASFRL